MLGLGHLSCWYAPRDVCPISPGAHQFLFLFLLPLAPAYADCTTTGDTIVCVDPPVEPGLYTFELTSFGGDGQVIGPYECVAAP